MCANARGMPGTLRPMMPEARERAGFLRIFVAAAPSTGRGHTPHGGLEFLCHSFRGM
jgi:hypothetical protein